MDDRQLVEVRGHGRARVITLKREEKLNALSAALERELCEALRLPEVTSSSCLVVTGAGRAFSAGADVGEFRDLDPASVLRYYDEAGSLYEQLASSPLPTIAAIHGYCLGGGFELALACDFRVAEESAVFGFPEVGLGILPSAGGTQRLVSLLGPARAKELILLGPRFGAARAHELGLVTEVVPDGIALERALELAGRLEELPPAAVRLAKRAIDLMPDAPRGTGLLIELLAYGMLAQTEDAHEAAEAFAERRSHG